MAAKIMYKTCKAVLEKQNHPECNLFSDQRPALVRFETREAVLFAQTLPSLL